MLPNLGVWKRVLQTTLPEKQYLKAVSIVARDQTGCVTLGKLHTLSVPQFSYLSSEDDTETYL